jgi:hypothetical protein
MPAKDLLAQAEDTGFSKNTLYRAKEKLKGRSYTETVNKHSITFWTLPLPDDSPRNLGNLGNLGKASNDADFFDDDRGILVEDVSPPEEAFPSFSGYSQVSVTPKPIENLGAFPDSQVSQVSLARARLTTPEDARARPVPECPARPGSSHDKHLTRGNYYGCINCQMIYNPEDDTWG